MQNLSTTATAPKLYNNNNKRIESTMSLALIAAAGRRSSAVVRQQATLSLATLPGRQLSSSSSAPKDNILPVSFHLHDAVLSRTIRIVTRYRRVTVVVATKLQYVC
jgi:hypothetical protein